MIKVLRNTIEDMGFKHWEADLLFNNRYTIDLPEDIPEGKIKTCWIDIETAPEDTFDKGKDLSVWGEFPSVDEAPDAICCLTTKIGDTTTVWLCGPQDYPGTRYFPKEVDMLNDFIRYFHNESPDIISAWNLDGFDLPYIINRCKRLGVEYKGLSKTFDMWENEFKGRKEYKTFGTIQFDLLEGYKLWRKYGNLPLLESYKLDFVAKTVLNDQKLDHGKTISYLWKNDLKTLIEYNVQDVELLDKIDKQCKIVDFFDSIRRKCRIQFNDVYKTTAMMDGFLISRLKHKIILPTAKHNTEDKFGGAYVFPAIPGVYDFVLCQDIASMYPNIIKNFNISYETLGDDIMLPLDPPIGFNKKPGIIPMFLSELKTERDEFKRLRKKAKDKEEHDLYDQRQYATKVIMNSLFGYLGFPGARLYKREVAAAITGMGQFMIKEIAKWCEELGNKVIYGDTDSCAGNTLITVRNNNGVILDIPIKDLYVGKEVSTGVRKFSDSAYEALTIDINGKTCFRKINYVMKHNTDKQMCRVHTTNTQHVDVTEDHSLMGYLNNNHIKTNKIMKRIIPFKIKEDNRIKSLIEPSFIPRTIINSKNYPKVLYEFFGFFIGDGSLDNYKKRNYYGSLSGGLDQQEVLQKIILPLKELGYIKNYWLRKNGDIRFNGLELIRLLEKEFVINGIKTIPNFLLDESKSNICSFVRGYFSADGGIMTRNKVSIIRVASIRDDFLSTTKRLLQLVGIGSSVFKSNTENSYEGKKSGNYTKYLVIKTKSVYKDIIGFMLDRKNNIKLGNGVSKSNYNNTDFVLSPISRVDDIESDNFVYDIEVDGTHTFFGNGILMHNSVYITSTKDEPYEVVMEGVAVAKYINVKLEKMCMDLAGSNHMFIEFEKALKRVLFTDAKKRYAYTLLWENEKYFVVDDTIHIQGFDAKRCILGSTQLILKRGNISNITNASDLEKCNLKETKIMTEQGYKQIKNVYTNIETNVHRITLSNGSIINCSATHKFLVKDKNKFITKQLKNIQPTDMLPMSFKNVHGELGNYNLGRFLGLFLAEGSFSPYGISFSFNIGETEYINFIKSYSKSILGIEPSISKYPDKTLTNVMIYGEGVKHYVKQFVKGDSCDTKHLSSKYVSFTLGCKQGIIDGMMEGDGHIPSRTYTTTSKKLIKDLQNLCAMTNSPYSVYAPRISENYKTIYRLRILKITNGKYKRHFKHYENDMWWLNIRSIEVNKDARRTKGIKTYDIEVDSDTHLFKIGNGIVTHNSDSNIVSKIVQKEVIHKIINYESKEKVVKYLKSMEKDMRAGKFSDEEIGVPKGITKSLTEYNPPTPIIKGAFFSNKMFNTQFGRGSKPKFVYITSYKGAEQYMTLNLKKDGRNYTKEYLVESIAYDTTIPEGFKIDWDKMSENTFYKKLNKIFEAAGWEWEVLTNTGLSDWW